MKKQLLFLAAMVLTSFAAMADCQDGPYALYANGASVASFTDAGTSPDGLPQLNAVAYLNAGDVIEFVNTSCDGRWFPGNVEKGGEVDASGNFSFNGTTSATCNVAGCYNFWFKKKENDDRVYIGSDGVCNGGGDNGGNNGGNGGGNTGGSDASGHSFYIMGWINGADAGEAAYAEYNESLKFVNGKVTIDCKMGSYVAVKDEERNYYYAEGTSDAKGSTVNLKWANGWSPCQKWALLEGTQYIIMRSCEFKGNIVLETVDKATYDAFSAGTGDSGNDNQGGNQGGNDNQGGNQGGNDNGNQGGQTGDVSLVTSGDYYAVGYINGADYGMDGEDYMNYPFVGGRCSISLTETSYFYVRQGDSHFMTHGWQGEVPYAELYEAVPGDNGDKLQVAADVTTLYLYQNNAGSLILSTIEIQQVDALDEVQVTLDLNAPMFNVLGQQVSDDYKGIVIQNGRKFVRQ